MVTLYIITAFVFFLITITGPIIMYAGSKYVALAEEKIFLLVVGALMFLIGLSSAYVIIFYIAALLK